MGVGSLTDPPCCRARLALGLKRLLPAWILAPLLGLVPAQEGPDDRCDHSSVPDEQRLAEVHRRQKDYRFPKVREDVQVYRGEESCWVVKIDRRLHVATLLQHVPAVSSPDEQPGQPSSGHSLRAFVVRSWIRFKVSTRPNIVIGVGVLTLSGEVRRLRAPPRTPALRRREPQKMNER